MRATPTMCAVAVAFGVLAAGCGGGGGEQGPAATLATASTTERTTTTLSTEAEVEAAYLKSWDVYTDAMRTFDTSKLAEVYTAEALALRIDEVNDLKAANTPGRMEVVHDISVQLLDNGEAVVTDNYLNHSVLLDGDTGEPTEADPNEIDKHDYPMRRVDGRWKVWFVIKRSP